MFPDEPLSLPSLSPTELKVLRHIGEGLSSSAVAVKLIVSKRTVDFHLSNIYRKWRVSNRIQALRIMAEMYP